LLFKLLLNQKQFVFIVFLILVPPVLADEDDSVAMGWETVAGEVDVVADALRAIAVVAHTV